jgi:hypothetical protein
LSRSTAIVRPFPKKRKVHIDVPQLPNLLPEGRKASERTSTLPLQYMRENLHRATRTGNSRRNTT